MRKKKFRGIDVSNGSRARLFTRKGESRLSLMAMTMRLRRSGSAWISSSSRSLSLGCGSFDNEYHVIFIYLDACREKVEFVQVYSSSFCKHEI